MTLGAGVAGALLGSAIHNVSALAGAADPSGLAGLAAVAGIAIEAGVVAKKSGRSTLGIGLGALVCGLLVFGYLNLFLPLTYSASSWALLFMVLAYGTAPQILTRMQVVKNRMAVPMGVAAGTVALSTAMILGDMQIGKRVPPDLGRNMSSSTVLSGARHIAPGEPFGAGWMVSVVQQTDGLVRGKCRNLHNRPRGAARRPHPVRHQHSRVPPHPSILRSPTLPFPATVSGWPYRAACPRRNRTSRFSILHPASR